MDKRPHIGMANENSDSSLEDGEIDSDSSSSEKKNCITIAEQPETPIVKSVIENQKDPQLVEDDLAQKIQTELANILKNHGKQPLAPSPQNTFQDEKKTTAEEDQNYKTKHQRLKDRRSDQEIRRKYKEKDKEDEKDHRVMELCKFYTLDCCAKKDKCTYMHGDFPCKYYYLGMECPQKDECKYLHGEPLSEQMRNILLKHIERAPKDVLGDFKRISRESATKAIKIRHKELCKEFNVPNTWAPTGRVLTNSNRDLLQKSSNAQALSSIPSLLSLDVKPPPEITSISFLSKSGQTGSRWTDGDASPNAAFSSSLEVQNQSNDDPMIKLEQQTGKNENFRIIDYKMITDATCDTSPRKETDSDFDYNQYKKDSNLSDISSNSSGDECGEPKLVINEDCSKKECSQESPPSTLDQDMRLKVTYGRTTMYDFDSSKVEKYERRLQQTPQSNIPAKVIDGSINSHAPINFKLYEIEAQIPPSFPELHQISKLDQVIDPRLRRILGLPELTKWQAVELITSMKSTINVFRFGGSSVVTPQMQIEQKPQNPQQQTFESIATTQNPSAIPSVSSFTAEIDETASNSPILSRRLDPRLSANKATRNPLTMGVDVAAEQIKILETQMKKSSWLAQLPQKTQAWVHQKLTTIKVELKKYHLDKEAKFFNTWKINEDEELLGILASLCVTVDENGKVRVCNEVPTKPRERVVQPVHPGMNYPPPNQPCKPNIPPQQVNAMIPVQAAAMGYPPNNGMGGGLSNYFNYGGAMAYPPNNGMGGGFPNYCLGPNPMQQNPFNNNFPRNHHNRGNGNSGKYFQLPM